jgi:hypothetical protein
MEPGLALLPQQSVVYFARSARVVKVGCTLQLPARMAQLRAEEKGLKLAAWLWGDEEMETFVLERFSTVRGREWLKPCSALDALLAGLRERQHDDVESMIYLYETLAEIPTFDGRRLLSSRLFGFGAYEEKRAAEEVARVKKHVAKWVAKIRAHHEGTS